MPRKKVKQDKGVIAFDFDGVISDSVGENFVQATKAYSDVGGNLPNTKETEMHFREARPLITKAEHYFTVLHFIESNPDTSFSQVSQAVFDAQIKRDSERAEKFRKRFYEHRKQMQASFPKEWGKLQQSFPRIVKFIRRAQKKNHIFIATTKDGSSVFELLKRYGINIPRQNIVANEFSRDKKEQLKEIARRSGRNVRQIVLVEDMPKQVMDIRKIGAKGVLVPWGYSTVRQRKEAKKNGIPIIGTNKRSLRKVKRMQRRA